MVRHSAASQYTFPRNIILHVAGVSTQLACLGWLQDTATVTLQPLNFWLKVPYNYCITWEL
jgi:hypothetical protein